MIRDIIIMLLLGGAIILVVFGLVIISTPVIVANSKPVVIETPSEAHQNNILILINLQHFCIDEHWKGKWEDTTYDACARFSVAVLELE